MDLPVRWHQTTHAMTRAAHAVAMDARKKLQEIAAKDLGGKPKIMISPVNASFGRAEAPVCHGSAAQRAVQLGGVYDGHDCPRI